MDDIYRDASADNNEDRVEVLDNGNHVGWADVLNGQWSFSTPALAGGLHSLTARCRGVEE